MTQVSYPKGKSRSAIAWQLERNWARCVHVVCMCVCVCVCVCVFQGRVRGRVRLEGGFPCGGELALVGCGSSQIAAINHSGTLVWESTAGS